MSQRDYMKMREVTERFSLGRYKVWRLLATGEILGSKHGREWLINVGSILKFLKKYQNVREA